ncbi:MAG: DUF3536 domain-containing protein [Acidobacteria bacterium]|nr:DUF3536 domain-containing protein [Acidobacteriota bacterium]
MERYICIHGHFYQPPRENPWLEAVELQDSAYPYHDWNERITAECYAPNSASRILDADSKIIDIVNNYSRISFNFGPTLLAWLEQTTPNVYQAILDADKDSRQRHAGHGSALAQAYNHMILPLANRRDKRTQILWGIRDFQQRFGRDPEGMWLPETAVDIQTLDILAGLGIRFTILSPNQASHVRPIGGRHWRDVRDGRVDPSTAYRLKLPSRRTITIFFYDGPISRAIAFEDLLSRGENLAGRLCGAFNDDRTWPQLVHIATDGETYGHHRRHADMALAYALNQLESCPNTRLTNFGQFLEMHPPIHEVRIIENSSWSCIHGIGRWSNNCGCNSGSHGNWNQEWRAPLREALDWLCDQLAPLFEFAASKLFIDPWRARDDYIRIILDRSQHNLDSFFQGHCKRELSPAERTRGIMLLELQRHAMLMYTSCGWFFDELSGIETVQVIQYAGRALQLGIELFGDGLEAGFLERLERAKSNLPEHRDGKRIYEKFVRPAMIDLEKVGAHYAISSLFEDFGEEARIYCNSVQRHEFQLLHEGAARLAIGKATVSSLITGQSVDVSFGVLHLGDQNICGGVSSFPGEEKHQALAAEVTAVFRRGDLTESLRALDRSFGGGDYSVRLLFRDQQRKIVNLILEEALTEAASLYRNFYLRHGTLLRFVGDLGIPLPTRFNMAVDFTLNEELRAALTASDPDPAHIQELLQQVQRAGVSLDSVTLEFAVRRSTESAALRFHQNPDLAEINAFDKIIAICRSLPFEVNIWAPQNAYFDVMRKHLDQRVQAAENGDSQAASWVAAARSLGDQLSVATHSIPVAVGG